MANTKTNNRATRRATTSKRVVGKTLDKRKRNGATGVVPAQNPTPNLSKTQRKRLTKMHADVILVERAVADLEYRKAQALAQLGQLRQQRQAAINEALASAVELEALPPGKWNIDFDTWDVTFEPDDVVGTVTADQLQEAITQAQG